MILILDNYDSFVYNLARYIERLGGNYAVHRNDMLTLEDIEKMAPEAIVISPGPCTPQQAGISIDVVRRFGPYIPILGVCLGHQAIGEAYGGQTVRAERPVHGKATDIEHNGTGLFQDIPNPMKAGRYHSLVVELPVASELITTAVSPNQEIMAIQHKKYPVYGVQFHPESVLTSVGIDLLYNFVSLAYLWNQNHKDNILKEEQRLLQSTG